MIDFKPIVRGRTHAVRLVVTDSSDESLVDVTGWNIRVGFGRSRRALGTELQKEAIAAGDAAALGEVSVTLTESETASISRDVVTVDVSLSHPGGAYRPVIVGGSQVLDEDEYRSRFVQNGTSLIARQVANEQVESVSVLLDMSDDPATDIRVSATLETNNPEQSAIVRSFRKAVDLLLAAFGHDVTNLTSRSVQEGDLLVTQSSDGSMVRTYPFNLEASVESAATRSARDGDTVLTRGLEGGLFRTPLFNLVDTVNSFSVRDVDYQDGLMAKSESGDLVLINPESIYFETLAQSLYPSSDTLVLWYPEAFGFLTWLSNSGAAFYDRWTTTPNGVKNWDTARFDGVLTYVGPDSHVRDDVQISLPQKTTVDRDGLWNTSAWVVFHINSVAEFIGTNGRYRVTLASGTTSDLGFGRDLSGGDNYEIAMQIGSAARRYDVSRSALENELVDGWNHISVQRCQDDAADAHYKARLYVNSTLVAEFEESSVDAQTVPAVSGESGSITQLRADSEYHVALVTVQNKRLTPADQAIMFDQFKRDHGISSLGGAA